MDIKIHVNPSLAHQRDHGEWFKSGFARHGINATVTSSITAQADIHVVSGCWYAKKQWLGHPRVILLDRCFYKGNPDHVSLGWMNERGGRKFHKGNGRLAVEPLPLKTGRRSIFLADYRGPVYKAGTNRPHPSESTPVGTLQEALQTHDIAIGHSTTALVDAALMGLQTVSHDPDHILNQPNWPELLPWADWHHSEISNGDAWLHLQQSLPQL